MTMHDEMLVRALEAERRREEAALARLRIWERRQAAAQVGLFRSMRRAAGHRLIDLGLRVAAVHPAASGAAAASAPPR